MNSYTRRDILKGVTLGAGSVLLSPILHRLEAQAAGVGPRPRFLFLVEGNGLIPEQVQPIGIEREARKERRTKLVEQSLAEHDLPPSLEPLQKYKDRMCIVQGLSGRICGGGHSNDFGALGAYPARKQPLGETIDAAVAKAHPAIFPLVDLGIADKPEYGIIYNCSAWGPGKKMPTQCNPEMAYNALFGSVAEGNGRNAFAAKSNLLDFMIDDIKRVESTLGGADREHFQSYLSAYERMSDRQSRLVDVEKSLRKNSPKPNDKYRSEVETDRLDAQFDIAAATLISGLSNVVTLASGVGNQYFSIWYRGLGIGISKHGIGHGGNYKDWTANDMAVMIRRFHMQLLARLMDQLNAVPEEDGTMLDNTLIVYLSDAAESHHSRCWEWPFVVIGDLNGRLKTRDRYVEYPYHGLAGHRTIASLYNTLLHAAGAPRDDFGMPDPALMDFDQSGPLSELLA